MECLTYDREQLLAFYDSPAEHWVHLRTTNPIESTFATVRFRQRRTKGLRQPRTVVDDGVHAGAAGRTPPAPAESEVIVHVLEGWKFQGEVLVSTYQLKRSPKRNCRWSWAALVMRPKSERFAFGLSKCGVLLRLNASARNCRLRPSRTGKLRRCRGRRW